MVCIAVWRMVSMFSGHRRAPFYPLSRGKTGRFIAAKSANLRSGITSDLHEPWQDCITLNNKEAESCQEHHVNKHIFSHGKFISTSKRLYFALRKPFQSTHSDLTYLHQVLPLHPKDTQQAGIIKRVDTTCSTDSTMLELLGSA